MQSELLRIVQIFRTTELLHFKMQNKTNHSLCVATRHIKKALGGWGWGTPSILAACSSLFICWTNVAAVSQWSLWHADDRLAEATGASQSNDDLNAQNLLELHLISLAPPTLSYHLYHDKHRKSCFKFISGLLLFIRLRQQQKTEIK